MPDVFSISQAWWGRSKSFWTNLDFSGISLRPGPDRCSEVFDAVFREMGPEDWVNLSGERPLKSIGDVCAMKKLICVGKDHIWSLGGVLWLPYRVATYAR